MIIALHRHALFVLTYAMNSNSHPTAHHRVASSPYFSLIFARALVFSR